MRAARAAALLAAAWSAGALAYVIAHRLAYPFDLEWLEGATLWHAQRILDGQPLYPSPSIDFIPHPYPPLYPALVALVGRVAGVSYVVGRALSVASFAGALALGWSSVRAAGGTRAHAAVAMAIPCAAFAPTGAWIDLVRVDALWLFLTAAGTTLAWRARAWRTWRAPAGVAAGAALLVAAFFTKQTAAPFMLAAAVGLAVADRRAALVFVAALALVGLPALAAMQRATHGWFWFYIFGVHHSHPFFRAAAGRAAGRVLLLLLPALPLVASALRVDRSPALRWAAWMAATGLGVSAVGKGTAGATWNAILPGIYFGAVLIGVAAARLGERRATAAWALLAATVALAPGGLRYAMSKLRPSLYANAPTLEGYALAPLVPTAEARARNQALLARVAAVAGEVWLPSRPWYAVLAGKRPLAGEMGAADVGPTGVAIPGLDAALRTQPFSAVVVDEPHDACLDPLFARSTPAPIDGVTDVDGVRRPAWWLTPRATP